MKMNRVLVQSFSFLVVLSFFKRCHGFTLVKTSWGSPRSRLLNFTSRLSKGKLAENECRYTTSKVWYTTKTDRSLQCRSVSFPCLNPNYPPFVKCSTQRCTVTKKTVPLKKSRRQRKTVCCPGWKKNETSNDCSVETCITLPQFTPLSCETSRQRDLELNRAIYRFTTPLVEPPQAEITGANLVQFLKCPTLNLTSQQITGLALRNTHERQWVHAYATISAIVKGITENTLRSGVFNDLEKFSDYAKILDVYQQEINATKMGEMCRFPSNEEDFKDIMTDDVWQNDQIFVEQRLAGLNPMSIRKLRLKEYLGRRSQFNPVLDTEIAQISKKRTNMMEMVKKGLVYILDYPDMNNITTMPDATDLNPNDDRRMTSFTSPIAIFVSLVDSFSGKREVKPLAIQTDFTGFSSVLTPRDGSKWQLAKEIVQRADLHYVEIVEHLLKSHLLFGTICTSIQRHISAHHPLYDVLKYHCRGVLVTNSVAFPSLLYPDGILRQLFTTGHVGCVEMLNNAFPGVTWSDANFLAALKKRGVNDASKLPYFPYRDDGIVLWKLVKDFARELVNLYYHNAKFVVQDVELQSFANELSDKGTGSDGGKGMVKDFPNKIKSKWLLVETLARIFFMPIQHSAINYPATYYAAFPPNMPTKLYDDPRETPKKFSIHSLPQGHVATPMVGLSMLLAALRYDNLFDYHPDLQDKKAAELVAKYYKYLNGPVLKELKSRNKQRLAAGHLTYPYFLPGWLPNSIHT